MRKLKKLTAVIMAIALIFSLFAVSFAAADEAQIQALVLDAGKDTAQVSLTTGTACTLWVALYSENGQMLGAGTQNVGVGEQTQSVRLSATAPERFTAKAFLLDKTNVPLCASFLLKQDGTQPVPPDDETKILVAYFSATNTTKCVAQYIADAQDANLYEIIPAIPYTSADLNYNNSSSRTSLEINDPSARPEISGSVDNMEDYDIVFLGYPILWGQAPRIISTFLESYDFNGKTIVPFCTSASSGIGSSARNLHSLTDGASWLDGQRFSGSASQSTVQTWVNGLNLKKENTPTDSFVKVDGGRFTMGSPSDEAEREDDEIPHEVTVGSFYLSPTEVTQREYQTVIGSNPSERKGDNLPVTNVSWYDAVGYCNALSRTNGLTEAYTINGTTVIWNKAADGYRLPIEAEWEYAARSDTKTPFSFGDYVHDTDANCYNAYGYNNNASGSWVNGYLEHTVDVKSYPANANGLCEIHGNAAEWVWDWYGTYKTAAAINPAGPDTGSYKVARGGAWNDFPKHIRSAYRSANAPDVGTYGIGIRLARGAVEGAGTATSTFSTVEQKSDKKVLIAYFSQTGNTKGLTDIIAEMTGADVFHIERTTDYSSTHNSQGLYAEALDELRAVVVPDLKTSLADAGYNINEYDTILLGYCNWWASIPAPVRSFLKGNDLSGKTIIPYCSMGGGRFGQTISAVAKLAPNSNIKTGLDTVYSSYDRNRIHNWLADNGIPTK